MKKILSLIVAIMLGSSVWAAPKTSVDLSCCEIVTDASDYEVVGVSAGLLAKDIEAVCGKAPKVLARPSGKAPVTVIAGTIGHSSMIDALVKSGKLDVSDVSGKWECYKIVSLNNPARGVKKALVVAGSDRRGTAYGVLSISKAIGVNPWYWWAEAPIAKSAHPTFDPASGITSKEPSVKYRGIFINDEDWGLLRWVRMTFDKEQGNIGPKTYEKVFELLLRLNANLLHPAMHEASTAFNKIPQNAELADKYAIVMGSTHCNPLLFNTASEWNRKTMGEWNFDTNGETINSVLRRSVEARAKYENIYTLALRGLHDRSMQGSSLMADRLRTLQNALAAQRQIVADVKGESAETIPQIFMPYKEVLDVYDAGLKLPDDVTLVWPDDNFGYMKRVSNPDEQKRSGRSGVYYHVSYLGGPHEYLWLDTNSPVLMYEELGKVYNTGGDRLWVVNAGDIKSCEFGVDLFLQMAYDWPGFNYDNVWNSRSRWAAGIFGQQYESDLQDIFTSYYDLAFQRKPEGMGWGYDWNNGSERCTDTEFSWTSYREAERRLAEYDRIALKAQSILDDMPEESKAAFYHLVYYPVNAASLMNKVHLYAQQCREFSSQGRASAQEVKAAVKMYRDSLQTITKAYDMQAGGKWDHVMGMNQCGVSSYYKYPELAVASYDGGPSWGVQVEGESYSSSSRIHSLPCFLSFSSKSYSFWVYSRDGKPLDRMRLEGPEWLTLSLQQDQWGDTRVYVNPDWSKIGKSAQGVIKITVAGEDELIAVSAVRAESIPSDIKIVECNGVVALGAADYTRKVENEYIQFKDLKNFGCEGSAVLFGDPLARKMGATARSPRLEYDFWTFSRGMVDVYTYVLPTFALYGNTTFAGHETSASGTKYGVQIDGGAILSPAFSSTEYAFDWYVNVLRNCSIKKTTLYIDKPGRHTLSILCGDPGMVFQKAVIDFGGMRRSYMGPEPTIVK